MNHLLSEKELRKSKAELEKEIAQLKADMKDYQEKMGIGAAAKIHLVEARAMLSRIEYALELTANREKAKK